MKIYKITKSDVHSPLKRGSALDTIQWRLENDRQEKAYRHLFAGGDVT